MKDYKVETKPTLWHVVISHGEYSDYQEEHLFFRANSDEEVWGMLCIYWDGLEKKCYPNLIWNDKRFESDTPATFRDHRKDGKYNWDTYWYHAEDVEIKRLEIIEFLK